jgi:hypothetical protein
VEHHPTEGEHLLLATGQLSGPGVHADRERGEQLEHAPDPALDVLLVPSIAVRPDEQVVPHREGGEDARAAREHLDAEPRPLLR